MKFLISGGCKNGKSDFAQRLAKMQNPNELYYIATMSPVDDEDLLRIKHHQNDRFGMGFETIEQSQNVANCIENRSPNASFLLDSTTALLANEMFSHGGEINFNAPDKVRDDLLKLTNSAENIVIVSDYIYSYTEVFDEATTAYINGLAMIDKALARECEVVLEFIYGNYIVHKGKEIFDFEVTI